MSDNNIIKDIYNIIIRGIDRNDRVIDYIEPENMNKLIDFSLDNTILEKDLVDVIDKIMKYSVNTQHHFFFNQLYAGADIYGIIGEFITAVLNTSMYTYEVAPVFNIMEKSTFNKVNELFGFDSTDIIFGPGGSMSNLYAVYLARYKTYPEANTKGMKNAPDFKIFGSKQMHYSIKKSASLVGIGRDNIILVECDENGRMIPEELEKEIIRCSGKPILVVATAGTTVFGAFDPILEIAEITRKYNIWLHVDASWGGSVIFSDERKHLLDGINLADSVTWNPHKMLQIPLQCSLFMVNGKHGNILAESNSTHAKYLFQQDKHYDTSYDTGDKYIQCGRKVDILKLWLPWKIYGDRGFADHVDKNYRNANYFYQKIREHPHFQLVNQNPACTNICFYYLKEGIQLDKIAPMLKEKMMKSGKMMISYQPLGELPNFFRIVFINSELTFEEIDKLVEMIDQLGQNLS